MRAERLGNTMDGDLGVTTLRKGHTALFWFGIIFPILWIVGALMAPTPRAVAAGVQ
jgi:hypothetical protein